MSNRSLQVAYVSPGPPQTETWQYGTLWYGVDEIVIELGDAHWYGGGGLVHQQWPLEKLAQQMAPFITSDNGNTGLLGILEPFWWNSEGQGVLVEGDEMEVGFNAPKNVELLPHSFTDAIPNDLRPRLAAECETEGTLHIRGSGLTLRFFDLPDPRAVVETFWQQLQLSPPLPAHLMDKPLWTTWANFKNDISQEIILDFADAIQRYGFGASVFGIDAKWQAVFGDTHFDPSRFPNPRLMVDQLQQHNMAVTLWSIPFFMEGSEHFATATQRGYVIRREDEQPYIGQWWEGSAAFLDVTNPAALDWHLGNLLRLKRETGINGYKFDAGEAMFYMHDNTKRMRHDAPNLATQRYIQRAAEDFPASDIRSGWRSQSVPMLFRQWDKSTLWGFDNGLASCITGTITLNLLGYPFNVADMIGGNQYWENVADAELMIRWTQAVAPMPIIQFSLAPWRFGADCARICARYNRLHRELSARNIALAQDYAPIVRPLWWIAPQDPVALQCADQYLIGDDLLVAPVIQPGAEERDIYLPAGQWRSYWNDAEDHLGGRWLRDYPAPLDVLPLFIRA